MPGLALRVVLTGAWSDPEIQQFIDPGFVKIEARHHFSSSMMRENDAPTRIRAASHLDVARILAPAGEHDLALREPAANGFAETNARLSEGGVTSPGFRPLAAALAQSKCALAPPFSAPVTDGWTNGRCPRYP
jgi:hypothetical protein